MAAAEKNQSQTGEPLTVDSEAAAEQRRPPHWSALAMTHSGGALMQREKICTHQNKYITRQTGDTKTVHTFSVMNQDHPGWPGL